MATTSSMHAFNMAREDFWELYYGPMSLVEGPCVKRAMEVFSWCVPSAPIDSTTVLPMTILRQPSYRLTVRLKLELAEGWKDPFSELHLKERPPECEYELEAGCAGSAAP